MMKKYILLIVMLTAAISCSRVEDLMRGNSDKVKIVINGCEGDDVTRSTVKINPEAKANVTFSFENNDLLGVFPNGKDDIYSQQLKLKANVNGSQFSGTTVGWLLNSDITYAAYYPFNANYHQGPDKIVFSYKGQTQTGNGNADENLAHLGRYTFLYSEPVNPSDNSATFEMDNASAFLHIRHYSEKGGTFSAMTISTVDGSEAIPTEIRASLFSKTITNQGFTNSITISLDEYRAAERQNLNVWCALPPVDLSEKELCFTFIGKEGTGTENTSFTMQGTNLTASWEIHNFVEHTYALKYHANAEDASFTGGAKVYSDIVPATESSHTFTIIGTDKEPTRAGYKLSGWSLTSDGDATLHAEDTKELQNDTFATSDKTENLYAVWTEETTPKYTISVAVSGEGGTVSIDGTTEKSKTVKQNESVIINAAAGSGYEFDCWKIGDVVVEGADAIYTFNASADVTYTAYFTVTQPQADGSLPGEFTINANGDKVKFSQGNLQYQAKGSDGQAHWRFAEHQYDHVGDGGTKAGNVAGSDNTQISATYSGWIDLFGWATSGDGTNRLGTDAYQPWTTNSTASNYYHKDKSGNNTTASLSVADGTDWGCNSINYLDGGTWSSAKKPVNGWRTPTAADWNYIIGTSTSNRGGLMYIGCYITINSKKVYGIMLLPDGWQSSDWPGENKPENGDYNKTGLPATSISTTDFADLQTKGAVFLTQTGYRTSTTYEYNAVNSTAAKLLYYWASDRTKYNYANCLLYTNKFEVKSITTKQYGYAVRLVTDVPSTNN